MQCFAALDKANKELGYVHRCSRYSSPFPLTVQPCVCAVSRPQHPRFVSSFLVLLYRDMRISNIMEHRTDGEPYLPSGFSSGKKTFHLPGMTWSEPHSFLYSP